MKINLYIAIVFIIFFYLIYPILMFKLIKNRRVLKIIGIVSFFIYILILCCLVFGEVIIKDNFILLNIKTSYVWFKLNFIIANFAKLNVIYNLIMLFPVAAFVFSITKKRVLLKTIIISFLISFLIELFQFILPVDRTTELFDLLTNTVSGIIGFFYYNLFFKSLKKGQEN